jgi:predicted site-specific integrase-resolvase
MERIPTYVDANRLCAELSISIDTLARWMAIGRIPRPLSGPGKRLWKWDAVVKRIDGRSRSAPVSADRLGQEIEDAARAATTHR